MCRRSLWPRCSHARTGSVRPVLKASVSAALAGRPGGAPTVILVRFSREEPLPALLFARFDAWCDLPRSDRGRTQRCGARRGRSAGIVLRSDTSIALLDLLHSMKPGKVV